MIKLALQKSPDILEKISDYCKTFIFLQNKHIEMPFT